MPPATTGIAGRIGPMKRPGKRSCLRGPQVQRTGDHDDTHAEHDERARNEQSHEHDRLGEHSKKTVANLDPESWVQASKD
jgi:hypothetical protein